MRKNFQTDVGKPAIPLLPASNGSALVGLEKCPLSRRTPFGMTNVSMGQFSVSRYYGGCTFNGDSYEYLPDTDELIRRDVLRWRLKQLRGKGKAPNDQAQARRATDL